ncbi:MAG TPA: prepilin-type N-terminal cleavage/methylation domain-containing protein [Geobacteraceae bacterium]
MLRNGFTLVEVVVVMAIIATLMVIATLNFREFSRKCGIENQTKMLYVDLMKLRSHALFERQHHAVKLTPTLFAIYSSHEASGEPIARRHLRYPITNSEIVLNFNERGLLDGSFGRSICTSDDASPAAYDSLVVFTTRIQMGKREHGGACVSSSIRTN